MVENRPEEIKIAAPADLRWPSVIDNLVRDGSSLEFLPYQVGKPQEKETRVICFVVPRGTSLQFQGEGMWGLENNQGQYLGPGRQQWGLTMQEAEEIYTRANPVQPSVKAF